MAGDRPTLAQALGFKGGAAPPASSAASASPTEKLPTLKEVLGQGGASKLPSLKDVLSGAANPMPAPKSAGGFLGHLGPVGKAIGDVGHIVAKTGEGLASDAYNAPGGLYDLGKLEANAVKYDVQHPNFGKHESLHDFLHGSNNPASHKLGQVEAAQAKGFAKSVSDPHYMAQHPDQTLLSALTVLSAGAGGAARLGAASDALNAGDRVGAVRALMSKPAVQPRALTVSEKKVVLQASHNHLVRAVQAVHDKVIQRAIDDNPEGKVAGYGTKRAGGSLAETRRYQQAMQEAPAKTLQSAGRKLKPVEQAALRLTSENSTPEEALAFHQGQLEKGVNPAGQAKQIKLLRAVKDLGLTTRDEHGNVVIDAEKHPSLAKVDEMIAKGGKERDAILARTGQMTEQSLRDRANAPGRIRVGGKYIDAPLTDEAKNAAKLENDGQLSLAPRTIEEAVGKGIVGGESARPGRNYVPYYKTEPKAAKAGVTPVRGNVVGKVKNIVSKNKPFTGEALAEAQIPDKTTALVARQMQRAYRYLNTDQFRRDIAATAGTATRKSGRDILVNTQELKNAKVPDELRAQLGDKHLTLDEAVGHRAGFDAYRKHILPGLDDGTEEAKLEKTAAPGTPAPHGHRWVDKNLLGDLAHAPVGSPSKVARAFDAVNAAQTAATVYFKLGHVATRAGTNAVTNIIQGSGAPAEITKSFRLWHSLTQGERDKALAAVGHGAFHSLPSEGENVFGKIARKGAGFWAHRFDTPFRFNSLAYEARKAGFDTPDKFRGFLKDLENQHGLDAAQQAKVDWVAKRANREAIAYDRLNEIDKRYLNRAFWFWGWTKGATKFAGNTLAEHPYKSAVLGATGQQGAKQAETDLGDIPSYERGLFKVGGSTTQPLVANAATLSPLSTPAELAESVVHANRPTQAEQFSGYLNPALSMLGRALFHLDQYGNTTKKGVLANALSGVGATTPEASLITGLRGSGKPQNRKMFPASTDYAIEKFLLGSVTPRVLNKYVANRAARSEKKAAGR